MTTSKQPLLEKSYWARWFLHPDHYLNFYLKVESFLLLVADASLSRNRGFHNLHKKSQLPDRASAGKTSHRAGLSSTYLYNTVVSTGKPNSAHNQLPVSSPFQPRILLWLYSFSRKVLLWMFYTRRLWQSGDVNHLEDCEREKRSYNPSGIF